MDHLTGRLATLTPGFAGADIANAVNEAALIGMRPRPPNTPSTSQWGITDILQLRKPTRDSVQMIHFEQAVERVAGLERKSPGLVRREEGGKHHEAGHAICGWFFQWSRAQSVHVQPAGQPRLRPRATRI